MTPGAALKKRIAAAYVLDAIGEELLDAAAHQVDMAATLEKNADPSDADGRRRIAMARAARQASVGALKALHTLRPPAVPKPRPAAKVLNGPATDVRGVLA